MREVTLQIEDYQKRLKKDRDDSFDTESAAIARLKTATRAFYSQLNGTQKNDLALLVRMAGLGPAFADGDHLDLTSSAMGLAIEVRVGSTVELTKRSGRDEGDLIAVSAVAVAPARPAEVLAEAKRRGVT